MSAKVFSRKLIPTASLSKGVRGPSLSIPIQQPHQTLPAAKNPTFTFLSYNMLSPHYMWPQVYTYVPQEYKDWKYRHNLLEKEILDKYRSDIMCVQELTTIDYYSFWRDSLRKGFNYGSRFIAKNPPNYWTKSLVEMDGVGIFYNLDMFDYIGSRSINLNDLASTFDRKELDYMAAKEITILNGNGDVTGKESLYELALSKNQVCLFVMVEHKISKDVFVIINTHLYWKYEEVKLTQCMIIMRKLAKIVNELLFNAESRDMNYNKVKILFSGDLNDGFDSKIVQFLKGNKIEKSDGLKMRNPMASFLNHCCYDDLLNDRQKFFDNTCYSGKLKGIFDFVWYHDRDFKLKNILSGIEITEELNFLNQDGLPNRDHPSDHIPLLMEFEILP
ncbi:hypothetical protein TBLA_0E02260 [Henningerozyma blattae CBS 6284]|uniref:Endonuclease/exonuclease/phosphatase domain-containing protein n=1 Tax=Henningerozyma blattae (strain ATCC 34711 / CBS 6284 / DSM 70876 / NBRC 10599 / NRRL Y-10934 / UCD 77-7) TaxID=1071380 RepID=I2H4H7_HENB6|nr:hypothetical protein TBLA_0E02260 [Tetrapisispora blattae CBS 6284]CCH61279.1 hypothetical protein TBLA_0E02260 [Tetrapisispora blattae CBS 6284]